MSKTGTGWIGVDLDGTLAHHDGWRGIEHIGAPIEPMVARVRRWIADGRDVRIFTARLDGMGRDQAMVRTVIQRWCLKHLGRALPVTNTKDMGMIQLWDDRAVQVEPNTGRRMDGVDDSCLHARVELRMGSRRVCADCGAVQA